MSRTAHTAFSIAILGVLLATTARAEPQTFEAGSLIVPMDIDYQNDGMLKAFGLLYRLLLNDVTVYWVIDPDKEVGGTDFFASAVDTADDSVVVESHGYRGGPFVVDAGQADEALLIVQAWQLQHVTTVHRATAPFEGVVSKTMTVAPTIAVFADGNELIAFGYLNAAAIPDSFGQSWPIERDRTTRYPGYPDVLNVAEIRGPTTENRADGALFDDQGLPVYCQLMTMHWGVNERDDDAIAEIRSFLGYPTHFFAECQAVNAVENSVNGHFLTPNGYIMDTKPTALEFHHAHLPFVQFDGPFQTVGGSEPSYSLPAGDEYYDMGVVMATEARSPVGVRDVWMTGYLDGECHIDPKEDEITCTSRVGKISYLGGHAYSTQTPISAHPDTQGTRFFLNSLFEADCVTSVGQPMLQATLTAPTWTTTPQFDFQIEVANEGIGLAYELALSDTLPAGMSLVSATPGPDYTEAGELVWLLGNLGPERSTFIEVTVELQTEGTYANRCQIDFRVGQNQRQVTSNTVSTTYGPPDSFDDPLDGGGPDAGDDLTDWTDQPEPIDGDARSDQWPGGDDDEPDAGVEEGGEGDFEGGSDSGLQDTDDPDSARATAEEGCGCTAAGQVGATSAALLACVMLAWWWRRKRWPVPSSLA
ncbi:MAG: DUF11 domain-containing protein [Bradymonadales bacterium]|nr:DUF11 domain-containing protein [Bradymonadales bacterium]